MMNYKLMIVLLGAAIIFHFLYQEMSSLREHLEGLKLRVSKLEEVPNSNEKLTIVEDTPKLIQEQIIETPADQEMIDQRFAQMNDIVSRLGTKFQKNNLVSDTDEPSFVIANGEVWENEGNEDNVARPQHISSTSALYNAESSRIPESLKYSERQKVKKIEDTSETIKSYADSAITIKCWQKDNESKYNDIDGNKNEKYTQDSELESETLSLDLTNNSGRFRIVPKINTPPLSTSFEMNSRQAVSPRFGRALTELGKLMRKHVELEVGSSGSSQIEYQSDISSEITGRSNNKNNIKGTVYERK
jgi:hypothetical protein